MGVLTKKEYQQAIIGENLYSLLWCLFSAEKKTTVLIKDPHFFAENFLYISDLEKIFLKNWGGKLNQSLLFNIEDYLIPTSKIIYTSSGQFYHCEDVDLNILEFKRRGYGPFLNQLFPVHEDGKDLVAEYHRLSGQFVQLIFEQNFKKNLNHLKKILLPSWFDLFSKIKKKQKNIFYNCKESDRKLLEDFFHWQILFHYSCSEQFDEWKLIASLLYRMGGCYRIDTKALYPRLEKMLEEMGCRILEEEVVDFKFANRKPYGIELKSYMGAIYPQEIHLWGNIPAKTLINLDQDVIGPTFSFILQGVNHSFVGIPGSFHQFIPQAVYAFSPFLLQFRPRDSQSCEVLMSYQDQHNYRAENFAQLICPLIVRSLKEIGLLRNSEGTENFSIRELKQVALNYLFEDKISKEMLPCSPFLGPTSVDNFRLQNTFYWGTQTQTTLGPLSYLSKMKDLLL